MIMINNSDCSDLDDYEMFRHSIQYAIREIELFYDLKPLNFGGKSGFRCESENSSGIPSIILDEPE